MFKPVAILLAVFVFASAGSAEAQEYKDWWKYLEGEWKYEISSTNEIAEESGTATWEIEGNGNALRARFVDDDGNIGIELAGWQSETKTMVANGYGAKGDYWVLEYAKVTAKVLEGPMHGVLSDKTAYKGTFTGKQVNKNEWGWSFKGKTGANKDLVMTGKFLRQHYKDWWKFLEGEWTYKITPTDGSGTVTWRIVNKGSAMRARFVDDDGTTSIELSGWQSDSKTLVANGYGSIGNYWVLEFTKVTEDVIEGPNHGVLPDGTAYKGTFTGKMVNENEYQWDFKGETGAGKGLVMTGKYSRKLKK